jgi:hypothetical protein
MKTKAILSALVFFAAVLFSYDSVNAQIVDKVKDAASKTKDVTLDAADKTRDVTVDTTKKVGVVVTDGLSTAADKTAGAAKVGAKKTKQFGSHAVNVTENVSGEVTEGGKWFVVTTWDGTKWVSKRVWYKTKQAADAVN